ncbi:hypothetical protein B0H63DRAFT_450054 [Podospora didyma]|uniref:DUF6604 domain-containing protein n=1 Tax=Podospora didyma TaxID=330526 RepID=A0AAE0U0F5_9PEZI|nr:hypothetical protein B0H63DRAFT_450054 [Podospora didyma]
MEQPSTWRRYKQAEAQFTACVSGQHQEENVFDQDQKAPQLKSRRQKKKKMAAATAAAADIGSPPAQTIEDDDKLKVYAEKLEQLAQRVADNATPRDIPDAALNVHRDVISLRKRSHNFFTGMAEITTDPKMKDELKRSNARHAYLIRVLEGILAKLAAVVATAGGRPVEKTPSSSGIHIPDFINMFEHLDSSTGESDNKTDLFWVEQFDFFSTPETPPETAPETPHELTDDDIRMMVYLFFEDFNHVRNHLQERWCYYWFDKVGSLNVLAALTSHAMDTFYQMENTLISDLGPKQRDCAKMLRFVRQLSQMKGGGAPYFPIPDRPVNYRRNDMNEDHKQMFCMLMTLVNQASLLSGITAHLGAQPAIISAVPALLLGIEAFLTKFEITILLVFCLQVWFDIRYIVEHEAVHPFDQLQTNAKRLVEVFMSYDPNILFKGTTSGVVAQYKGNCVSLMARQMVHVFQAKDFCLADHSLEYRKRRAHQMKLKASPEPLVLLKNEPVFAGLLDLRVRLSLSYCSFLYVNTTAIVDSAVHVYQAALAADPGLPAWYLMRQHAATFPEDAPFRLGLQEGLRPLEIFGHFDNVKAARTVESEKSMYGAEVVLRRFFYKRYAGAIHKGLTKFDRAHIARLVHKVPTSWKYKDMGGDKSSWRPEANLLWMDSVLTGLIEKSRILELDYFLLHDQAVALLKDLMEAFGPDMRERVGYQEGQPLARLESVLTCVRVDLAAATENGDKDREAEILELLVRVCRESGFDKPTGPELRLCPWGLEVPALPHDRVWEFS